MPMISHVARVECCAIKGSRALCEGVLSRPKNVKVALQILLGNIWRPRRDREDTWTQRITGFRKESLSLEERGDRYRRKLFGEHVHEDARCRTLKRVKKQSNRQWNRGILNRRMTGESRREFLSSSGRSVQGRLPSQSVDTAWKGCARREENLSRKNNWEKSVVCGDCWITAL